MKRLVMKRMLVLLPVLGAAFAIAAAVAIAAPAPKTTGGIGYTAYSDVQRHLEFNAIQSKADTCGTFWNVTGTTPFSIMLDGDPTPGAVYVHDAVLAQNGQSVTGSGGYPAGASPYDLPGQYGWHVTSGSVVGNTLTLDMVYDTGVPGAVHHMTGTIASDGSISGIWNDNAGGSQRTGTFTAPAGSATALTYCGKGNAYYSDASGNWYFVNVKAVSVSGDDAWFAGPVIAGNIGVGNWLFVKVHDGGEPGKLVDKASGSFTDELTALNGVTRQLPPADGPFTITSGNLQTH